MSMRNKAITMFEAAVAAVRPENVLPRWVRLEAGGLQVGRLRFEVLENRGVHVFGSGKAAGISARVMETLLKGRLAGGLVVCQGPAPGLSVITACEGSHPVADEKSLAAADRLMAAMSRLSETDFFIYLLSGGSSALVEKPCPPLTLWDFQQTTRLLLASGAPIAQVNAVRKHLSLVKGGRLGRLTRASGVVLVISDVIGDDLEAIGSAPLYRDRTTFGEVAAILRQYGLMDRLPPAVAHLVDRGVAGEIEDTPKQANPRLPHLVAAGNRIALEAARETALSLGLPAHVITSRMHGEAREAAKMIAAMGQEILGSRHPFAPPVCLLFGGETTVTLRGKGKGGRNQEMCLSVLKEMGDLEGWLFLSAGTDGIDGASDAAGAMADPSVRRRAAALGLNMEDHLARNDSNGFFSKTGDTIVTGFTGTNVMDLAMLLIRGEGDL